MQATDSEGQDRYDLFRKVLKRVEVSEELVRIHLDTAFCVHPMVRSKRARDLRPPAIRKSLKFRFTRAGAAVEPRSSPDNNRPTTTAAR